MCRKICEQCGKEFEVIQSRMVTARFCSRKCVGKWRSENMRGENCPAWKGGNAIKICKQCGEEYETQSSQKNRSRFCSRGCRDKWQSENWCGKNNPAWGGGKILKTCDQCGEEYEIIPSLSKQRFCSRKCNGKWMSENMRGENNCKYKKKVNIVCVRCGKEFEVKPSAIKTRFCSVRCADKNHSDNIRGDNNPHWNGGKVIKICDQCGEKFEVIQSVKDRKRFCSRECSSQWQSENLRGGNSPTWRGGISFEPYCHKFNERFKESVRKKFNRTCFLCPTTEQDQMDAMRLRGKRPYKLAVHHIDYNKDCLCDDADCEFVPLCIRCHAKTNNNREYWEKTIMEKLHGTYKIF